MNRWFFRARQNECRVDTAVTVDGRLFYALAAATRNARSPNDDLLVAGTMSAGELDDLRRCLGSIQATCSILSIAFTSVCQPGLSVVLFAR